MIVFKNTNIFGEAEFQENSKKKIELIGVHREIKTKMLCAKAQRIESATRWSVFWGVRPSGSASFWMPSAQAQKFQNTPLPPTRDRITFSNTGHSGNRWNPFGGYWQDKCVILRVFVVACVFALSCAAFCLCGTSREGKRGATRGKRPWVFSPRAFRADKCGRSTHDPRFPRSFLEWLFLKNYWNNLEGRFPSRYLEWLFLKI